MEPGTASEPTGSLGKEWELAAVSPESSTVVPGMQVAALLWLTLWVMLRTWELSVHLWSMLNEFRGLSSGSLGKLSPGASCCMDGFAIQKGSADTNASSAMRTLSLHLFPLVKSDFY